MRSSRHAAIFIASIGLLSAPLSARADDTTTTTTTTRTDAPAAPGVTIGVPGVVGVEIGGDAHHREGCTTQKTTHTNEDTGDSVTHKTTDC